MTGFFVALILMSILGGAVLLFHDVIPTVYTNDPDLVARTAGVILVAAFIFVPDTMQVVMGQACRALGDAWIPLLGYAVSFVAVMVPLGWYLIEYGGWDERGLALAIAIACLIATVLLAWRFHVLTRDAA